MWIVCNISRAIYRLSVSYKQAGTCRIDPEAISRLEHVAETPFKRLTYTSAIELLKTAVDGGHKFENNEIVWGMDMASEHERCSHVPCTPLSPPGSSHRTRGSCSSLESHRL